MTEMDTTAAKAHLREQVIARRNEIPAAERERRSVALCERVTEHCADVLRPGAVVAAFCAFGSEPDLRCFIHEAYRRGCRVCLPCMVRDAEASCDMNAVRPLRRTHMAFVELDQATYDTREAAFLCKPARSIPADDPLFEHFSIVAPQQIDVVIAPMVACDAAGNRLGYGGGNYDQFLTELRDDARIVGVAFAEQQCASIPCEPHDAPLPHVEVG